MEPRELVARYQQVKSDRALFEVRWDQIRRYQRPDAAPFLGQESRGYRDHGYAYDTTAEDAADMMAAGIGGLMTGQAIDWHGWQWEDHALREDHEAKAWLLDASRVQLECYRNPRTRFGMAMDSVYLDLADFSNGCLFVMGRGTDLPLYLARPIQQVYWLENDTGQIDTVFWAFELSARQAAQKFGREALPRNIAVALDAPNRMEERFSFLHCVYPSSDPKAGERELGNHAFISAWVSVDSPTMLREGGYRQMPYIAFRWRVRAGERYARGPADKALPDVAVLQQMERLVLRGLEKTIDPSLMLPDDGVLGPVGIRSGDLTYVRPEYFFRGGDPIRPIQSGARPDLGEASAEQRRTRIQKAFLRDMLQILRDPRATATQVLEVREEMYRHASPVLNSLEVGSLGPMADRTFDLLLRANRFLPMPEHVANAAVEPTFQSPIARAQRMAYVRGFSQLWDLSTVIASVKGPEVLDLIDDEAGLRAAADALGTSAETIRSPDDVAAIREGRARAQQEAAEREAAKDETTALKNMAPFIKAVAQAEGEDLTAETPDPAARQAGDLERAA